MVKLNKIYTRTGDDGTTGLVDGSRTPKDAPRMAAIGDVDETNSVIGTAAFHATGEMLGQLRAIQNDLFDLGADLATPGEDFTPGEMTLRIIAAQVTRLETEIDAMNIGMKPLNSFIVPGGTALGTALHVAAPDISFVVFSNAAGPAYRKRYLGAGATGFLDKNAEFDQLARAVSRASLRTHH